MLEPDGRRIMVTLDHLRGRRRHTDIAEGALVAHQVRL
jgi:hypothetical protein